MENGTYSDIRAEARRLRIDAIDAAANRLARELRPFPWYHRTVTVVYGQYARQYLAVYGEGREKPAEVPAEYFGFPVEWRQVSKEKPCPFGSVQAGFCGRV